RLGHERRGGVRCNEAARPRAHCSECHRAAQAALGTVTCMSKLRNGQGREEASDRLLDVHEAAALLAVKPATLYQWAYQRRLPVVKLFGPRGALRFRLSDVDALIAGSVRPALRDRREG